MADQYYPGKYSSPVIIDPVHLFWFPKVEKPSVEFDLSPIIPQRIREILKKKSANSAPGEDGLLYGTIANFHLLLASCLPVTQKC